MNYNELECVEIEGIDFADAPDFVDAYITYAEYKGVPLTEWQLDDLNSSYPDLVYEYVLDHIY